MEKKGKQTITKDVVSVLATNFTKLQYTSLLTGYTFVIICYSQTVKRVNLFFTYSNFMLVTVNQKMGSDMQTFC